MLPLKVIQQTHPSAIYAEDEGRKNRDIVIADKIKSDTFWFDFNLKDELKLEFIPKDIVAEVNDLARPSASDTRSEAFNRILAKERVFPGFVESVIESMPCPHETDKSKIIFIDYLVVTPLNPIYSELKVYVPSIKAGMLRLPRTNLKEMVGRYVSCKIENLRLCKLPNFYETKKVWNNFYAEGSIDLAETLVCGDIKATIAEARKGKESPSVVNRSVLEQLKNEKAEWLSRSYNGIIAQTSNRGIYVICTEKELNYFTVFIPRGKISYVYESVIPNIALKFKIGEQISFKILDNQIYRAGKGLENQIIADAKCLETRPRDRVIQLIADEKLVGTTHKAYVVAYDVTRGHKIELEDLAGAIVKLETKAPITPDFVVKQTPIFVKVERARRTASPADDLRYSVYCSYISDAGTKEKAVSAFEF